MTSPKLDYKYEDWIFGKKMGSMMKAKNIVGTKQVIYEAPG